MSRDMNREEIIEALDHVGLFLSGEVLKLTTLDRNDKKAYDDSVRNVTSVNFALLEISPELRKLKKKEQTRREEIINTLRKIGLFIAGEVEELDTLDRKEDADQYDYRMENLMEAAEDIINLADQMEKEV